MKKLGMALVMVLTVYAALIVALTAALTMAEAEAEGDVAYVAVRKGTHLNGRAEPRKKSDAVARFLHGDEVEVVELCGGWAKLTDGGEAEYSYVAVEYLRTSPELEVIPMRVCSDGRVRVRESPDGKKVKGYVRDGDTVDVLLCCCGWAMTKGGWIKSEYLEGVEK